MSNDDERRRSRRLAAAFPVLVSVMMPEVSVVPVKFTGVTVDMSERGLLIELALEPGVYERIVRAKRVVRVQFDPPAYAGRLVGEIAWSESGQRGGAGPARFGIFFEAMDGESAASWRRFLLEQSVASKR